MLSTKVKESLGPLFPIANKIRLQWLKIKLAGDNVVCTCCKKSFKEFAPFGETRRANAWCPNCESLERHRLLWMFFENKTNLYTAPIKLLHIAPETVFFHRLKKHANIDYKPCDIFPSLYPRGTEYFDVLNHDLPNNSFDVIICNHVFQYIEEDRKAMKSLYNLMKPGGWGILQVPINTKKTKTFEDPTITDPLERMKAFGLKEHVRYYSYDYADRLREAGFIVTVIDYTKEFSAEEITRYGFYKGDAIYYCTK
jgi:SAM-dependent methyltransferase